MKTYKQIANAYPSPCQIKTAKTALKCQVIQGIIDHNKKHYGEREKLSREQMIELTKIKNLN